MIKAILLSFLLSFSGSLGALEPTPEKWDLYAQEVLKVYSAPSTKSEPLLSLKKGERLPVSSRLIKGFRRVVVEIEGHKRFGYVASKDIRLSMVIGRGKPAPGASRESAYFKALALGVHLTTSYLQQGALKFTEPDGLTTWTVSELTSLGYFPGLLVDFPLSDTYSLRLYVSQRSTSYKGKAKQESVVPTTTTKNLERAQNLVSFGWIVRIYPQFSQRWWWGGGGEVGKGTSLKLSLDGQELNTTKEDLPTFFIFYAATGFDFKFPYGRNWYLVPDIRVGSIVTTTPVSFLLDSVVGLSYRF